MMEKIWGIIPVQWKIAVWVGAAFAVLGLAWFVYAKIENAGYNRCQGAYKEAARAAQDKARENIVKVEKEYGAKIKEIQNAPDNDSAVGPLVTRVLDGL